ncbi:PDZ domain-containing protein [Algivirga pacifica]|uniref:PDZ domain-containing protein n=1 Tax=Algivirga pacifica TaxID=1162670 RepID=A0ABP9CYC0_9BACT
MLYRLILLLLLICSYATASWSQSNNSSALKDFTFEREKQKKLRIKFQLINNLIIIPVYVNRQKEPLNFVLDTGVGYPIMVHKEAAKNAKLNTQRMRKITIKGVGTDQTESLDAYHSWGNHIHIKGGVIGNNQDVLFPERDIYHLSENLGMEIHGLIGYNIFKDFVIDLNYNRKTITLYQHDYFQKKVKRRKKRYQTIPMDVRNRRAFITANLSGQPQPLDSLELMIDTGASNGITLFEDENENLLASTKALRTYLGVGLNGSLYGKLDRRKAFQIGDYTFKNPVINFPDTLAFRGIGEQTDRKGSVGGELLRRFKITLDYQNETIYLKKGADFSDQWLYNLSGLEVKTPIPGLYFYEIAMVRKGSPAEKAGILAGDQLLSINGVSTLTCSYEKVIELLHQQRGKMTVVVQKANGGLLKVKLRLKDPLQ